LLWGIAGNGDAPIFFIGTGGQNAGIFEALSGGTDKKAIPARYKN
jgi:hypothetical protein